MLLSAPKRPSCHLQPSPAPVTSHGQPLIYFLSLEICLFQHFTIMESYNVWSFLSGLFHLQMFIVGQQLSKGRWNEDGNKYWVLTFIEYSVCTSHSAKLWEALPYLIFPNYLRNRYYYSHFSDDKTEAHKV